MKINWRRLLFVVISVLGAAAIIIGFVSAVIDYRFYGKTFDLLFRTRLYLCRIPPGEKPIGEFVIKTDPRTRVRYCGTAVHVWFRPGTSILIVKKAAAEAKARIGGFCFQVDEGTGMIMCFQFLTEDGKEQETIARLKTFPAVQDAGLEVLMRAF